MSTDPSGEEASPPGSGRADPDAGFPILAESGWSGAAGLVAGISLRGEGPGGTPADFGLTTTPSAWALLERLEALGRQLGFPAVAVARQVHGDAVACLSATPEGGVRIPGEADGLITDAERLLLVVTAADCVPVYLADPATGGIGLLHAGWRGIAAGVLRAGVRSMRARFGSPSGRLRAHFGPAICGDCYEVGPEVLRALGREGGSPGHVDLRAVLVDRARSLGLNEGRISVSSHCTRCRSDQFHSHRGRGERAGRMAAFVGWHRRPG